MQKWLCIICGWVYDEAKGWPDDGIAPGTRWADIPDDWVCPDCGVAKSDFEMLNITQPAISAVSAHIAETEAPIIIIGSGYAGYALAQAIRQKNTDREIVLFTTDDGANYSKPALSTAFTKNKHANDLITESLFEVEQRLNIRIYARCKVNSINADEHVISTDYGTYKYAKLVLALGAAPISLNLQGNGAEDVVSINNLQDYRLFRSRLDEANRIQAHEKKAHITIIGNGLIGCEFANDLSSQGYTVAIVGLTDLPMEKLLPKPIAQALQGRLSEQGVDWYLENTVKHISKQHNDYRLTLADGQTINTNIVLSAVGLKPLTALAVNAGVLCNQGIVVNAGLRTNVADIYAIGDCAEIQGQLLPFIAPINYSAPALADCLLARPTMAHYPLMPIVIKTSALPITVLPPLPDQVGQWYVETQPNGIRGLFLNAKDELLAFALAGECVNERQQWLDKVIRLN